MGDISGPIPERDVFYYRARQKNRIFDELVTYFARRAEQDGITKAEIARKLKRDPAQVTRWLSQPSNLTLDTISDLLLALDAEMDCEVAPFEQRAIANAAHPFVAEYWEAGAPRWRETIQLSSAAVGTGSTATVRLAHVTAP